MGIDRYIRWSDLTSKEKDFLKLQLPLSLLNFADPFIWYFKDLKTETYTWNAKLTHYLTSFGYTVDAHLFLKSADQKFHFQLHNGFNSRAYFPGFSASWIDFPLTEQFSLTTDLTLWAQPKGQRFNAKRNEMLAAGAAEISYKLRPKTQVYLGLNAKTPGWMAGEVFLDRSVSIWSGIRLSVF